MLQELDADVTRASATSSSRPRRTVIACVHRPFARLVVGLLLWLAMCPIHFGMQRKQLLTLKRHAEVTAAARA